MAILGDGALDIEILSKLSSLDTQILEVPLYLFQMAFNLEYLLLLYWLLKVNIFKSLFKIVHQIALLSKNSKVSIIVQCELFLFDVLLCSSFSFNDTE